MASGTIYANGTLTLTVPASEKIAIFSNASLKLYQKVGYPNHPDTWDLIETTTNGEQFVSAAFTNATEVKIEVGPAVAFYETGAAPVIGEPQTDISAADATFTLSGLAAAQGGYVEVKGGTSSTAANAGGAAKLTGGVAGAEGVGGAATVTAGAGGATSGAGGVASVTGGAGTVDSAGGVGKVVGGAGNGTGNGGAGEVRGGAAGATGVGGAVNLVAAAGGSGSGAGGAVNATAGNGTAGNGAGGNLVFTAGTPHGSGASGAVINRGVVAQNQPTPTAKTTDATLTIAELKTKLLTGTHTAGATQTYTLPTGTLTDAGLSFAADDSFDWVLINLSAAAADTVTVAAGVGHTVVGNMVVQSAHATTGALYGSSGTFRTRKTGANTYVTYRIA